MNYNTYTNIILLTSIVIAAMVTVALLAFSILYYFTIALASFGAFMAVMLTFFAIEDHRERRHKQ